MTQRFELVEQPRANGLGSDHPPFPKFPPLVANRERERIFGALEYEAAPTADSPENIRILGDWEQKNITKVTVPRNRPAGPALLGG
jgi:hypothetical protein